MRDEDSLALVDTSPEGPHKVLDKPGEMALGRSHEKC